MIEKDFIKREIDQLGVCLRKVLSELSGFENNGNYNQGIEISESALKSQLDLDIHKLKTLSKDSLINRLTKERKFKNQNLVTLSKILFQISKNTDNRKMAQTTLHILEYLETSENTYSVERQNQIDLVKKIINSK